MNFNPRAETTELRNQTEAPQAIHLNVSILTITEFSHGKQVLFTFQWRLQIACIASRWPRASSLGPGTSQERQGSPILLSPSKKVFQSRIAFKTLHLLKYFGMVTTEQKEVEAC